jgi:hypothetical protein
MMDMKSLERFTLSTTDGLFTLTIRVNQPTAMDNPIPLQSVAELAQMLYDSAMQLTRMIETDG